MADYTIVTPDLGTAPLGTGGDDQRDAFTQLSANWTSFAQVATWDAATFNLAFTGWVSKPAQPAFNVRISTTQNNVTGNGTVYQVAFDIEIFDQNNDITGGVFTAPVTGKYNLSSYLRLNGIVAANDASIQIVTSNRTYEVGEINPTAIKTAAGRTTMAITCLADMEAGDTAFVALTVSGEASDVIDISGSGVIFSSFNGALIA